MSVQNFCLVLHVYCKNENRLVYIYICFTENKLNVLDQILLSIIFLVLCTGNYNTHVYAMVKNV